jgi:chromosome segregation ATPase
VHLQQLHHQQFQTNERLANEKLVFEQGTAVLQNENHSLKMELDSFAKQLNEKQERINELNRLHQQTQANLEHYREAAREQRLQEQQRHEQQQRQLEQIIDQLQKRLNFLENDKLSLQKEHEQICHEKESMQKLYDQLVREIDKMRDGLLLTEKERGENLQAKQHWQSQCELLQQKADEQTNIIIDSQKQIAVLSEQLCSAKSNLDKLTGQNQSMAHEKWIIIQEKAQLEGQLKQLQTIVA